MRGRERRKETIVEMGGERREGVGERAGALDGGVVVVDEEEEEGRYRRQLVVMRCCWRW